MYFSNGKVGDGLNTASISPQGIIEMDYKGTEGGIQTLIVDGVTISSRTFDT